VSYGRNGIRTPQGASLGREENNFIKRGGKERCKGNIGILTEPGETKAKKLLGENLHLWR